MCQKSSVQLPCKSSHYLKYDKSKNSAKYRKILMSRFWEIVFRVTLLFAAMFVSNLKHAPSRELPLTARKTVFSHLRARVEPTWIGGNARPTVHHRLAKHETDSRHAMSLFYEVICGVLYNKSILFAAVKMRYSIRNVSGAKMENVVLFCCCCCCCCFFLTFFI